MDAKYMRPLDPPITQQDILDDSKDVNEGKNPDFAMMVEFLYQLGIFEKPDNTNTSFLLYGDTYEPKRDKHWGKERILNQRCGRKSFIPREEAFWYEAGRRALGDAVVDQYSKTDFVRTPIWKIFAEIRRANRVIAWDRLDPVFVLQLLAACQPPDSPPAGLNLSPVENARPVALDGQETVRFHYSEDLPVYEIGQEVNLAVGSLKRSEDFVILDYAHRPYRMTETGNVEYQAQNMPYHYRNGDGPLAVIHDHKRNSRLRLGEYGELMGKQGFCLVTFPAREDELDPFGIRQSRSLIRADAFQEFVEDLRELMHRDPEVTVNLVEYRLI